MKNLEINLLTKFLVSLIILLAVHFQFVQEFDQMVIQMLLFQSIITSVTLELIHQLIPSKTV